MSNNSGEGVRSVRLAIGAFEVDFGPVKLLVQLCIVPIIYQGNALAFFEQYFARKILLDLSLESQNVRDDVLTAILYSITNPNMSLLIGRIGWLIE